MAPSLMKFLYSANTITMSLILDYKNVRPRFTSLFYALSAHISVSYKSSLLIRELYF